MLVKLSISNSVIGPLSYDEAVESCINDQGGILAPLNETAEITSALCIEYPTEFRIQGIAKDECWVDHEDERIDPALLSDQSGAEPFETLYVDSADNTINEELQDVEMAALCQFPKDPGMSFV